MRGEARFSETETTPETDPIFEAQFNDRKIIETDGSILRYADVQPPNYQPGDPTVLLAPGYLSGIEPQRLPIEMLYRAGFRVLAPDHRRRGRPVAPEGGYHDHVVQKSDALFLVLAHADVEKITLVGHSEGFISTILMAKRWGKNFSPAHLTEVSQIIGVAPYGLATNTADQLRGFAPMIADGIAEMARHDRRTEIAKATAKYIFNHPIRTVQEGAALRTTNAFDDAVKVAQDIPVHLLFHAGDKMVRRGTIDPILDELADSEEGTPFAGVSYVASRDSSHSAFLNCTQTVEAVIAMIKERTPAKFPLRLLQGEGEEAEPDSLVVIANSEVASEE